MSMLSRRFSPESSLSRADLRAAALQLVLTVLLAGQAAAQIPAQEHEVKAAYLLNFSRYVEWPSEAFEGHGAVFVIGVLGRDPFGEILDLTVGNRKVKNRSLQVRRFRDIEDVEGCHLLFIGRREGRQQASYLEALQGQPVLTVGESHDFLRDGGAINLVRVGQNIRFDVNLEATRAADLKISSRMLALARKIRDPGLEADE